MTKFLVGSTPLLGHIAPLAPIVAELVCRGHEVRWYTGEHYRPRVESTGACYLPMRFAEDWSAQPVNERFPHRGKLTGIRSLLFDINHIYAAQTVGHVLDLQEILKEFPADVMLSDTAFLAPGWVHERGGPPWAVLNPFAINLSGRDIPPFGLGSPPATTQFGRSRVLLQQILGRRFLYRESTLYVDRLRERVGLPPTGEAFWDRTRSPFLYMQGSVRGLEYPRNDLPPQFHFIGPSISHATPTAFEPPKWWDDLSGNQPVVLVTQGTLSNNPAQLIKPALEALADENVLIVVATGGLPVDGLNAVDIPAHARVESFIPFDHLLPHVDLMVTNGGYNGVQMALSHGVPLVVAGATEDKLEVNARVAWTGVGIDLKTGTPRPDAIHTAVRKILQDGRFQRRAGILAQEFQQHNGAATGADLLVELAATGEPVFAKQL
jgi:UDP:flavonoid glycosyltransferase YjiC (YdhE family)